MVRFRVVICSLIKPIVHSRGQLIYTRATASE